MNNKLLIRAEKREDEGAIAQVHTLAFGRENEAKLVERLRYSSHFIPKLSLVAELENTIVGHILLTPISLVGETEMRVLALAPLAVHPDFQRQGIGSALVTKGLEMADKEREALVIVLGHAKFYARFGFQKAIDYGIEPPFSVPEQAFRVKPLQHYQEKYRGKVVYPSVFDEV